MVNIALIGTGSALKFFLNTVIVDELNIITVDTHFSRSKEILQGREFDGYILLDSSGRFTAYLMSEVKRRLKRTSQ